MDTSVFFNYPTLASGSSEPAPDPGFLPHATAEEWDVLLAATETLRFRPGDVVLRAGERDRAIYLLLDGRVQAGDAGAEVTAPAAVGVAGFLDGLPRAVTLEARTHVELVRLSWDAYEALAARDPRLGRMVLADAGRALAARVRSAGASLPGWTG
jgi:CRP-like cAMP-binding protein